MTSYAFTFTMDCAVSIEADSEEEARRIMDGFWKSEAMPLALNSDEGDAIEGECTLSCEPILEDNS